MRRPIGDQNASRLLTVWTGNAVFFAWAFLGFEPIFDKLETLLVVPLFVAGAATLNGMIDSGIKDIFVFGRDKDTHPWRCVFSKHAPNDDRIDLEMLKVHESEALPVVNERQHSVWYKHSISVENNPYATSCRRDYLFARDYAIFAIFLVPFGLIIGYLCSKGYSDITVYGYVISIIVQCVVARWLARRHGRHYTTTVVATHFATQLNKDSSTAPKQPDSKASKSPKNPPLPTMIIN